MLGIRNRLRCFISKKGKINNKKLLEVSNTLKKEKEKKTKTEETWRQKLARVHLPVELIGPGGQTAMNQEHKNTQINELLTLAFNAKIKHYSI